MENTTINIFLLSACGAPIFNFNLTSNIELATLKKTSHAALINLIEQQSGSTITLTGKVKVKTIDAESETVLCISLIALKSFQCGSLQTSFPKAMNIEHI